MPVTNQKINIITIDGPSGTGKGTLCALLAASLGWHLLDSGAIYRGLAYAAHTQQISPEDIPALLRLIPSLNFHFTPEGEMWWQGQNIRDFIRQESIGEMASRLAIWPEIRKALLEYQHSFAQAPGLVTDGRDMGTVVFPEARVKFYLDASAEVRAQRRYSQLKAQDVCVSIPQVLGELIKRDTRDTSRLNSPLLPAVDAVIIDTTSMSIDAVLQNMLEVVYSRLGIHPK
ncbi:MAG: (d)CMP kinase [Legionellaceae bacterium]|nr:(d)CMP kinase [Legionellaceae bacterium]